MKDNVLIDLSMQFSIKIVKLCETIKGHYSLDTVAEGRVVGTNENPKVKDFYIYN